VFLAQEWPFSVTIFVIYHIVERRRILLDFPVFHRLFQG
jgi:hypothetical protein